MNRRRPFLRIAALSGALLAGCGVNGRAQSTDYNAVSGVWEGSYTCIQGKSHLRLTISGISDNSGALQARFEFGPDNYQVDVPIGSFAMKGYFDPVAGTMELQPDHWFVQPYGYIMVGLMGRVTGSAYRGQIEGGYGCSDFLVLKQGPPQVIASQPIPSAILEPAAHTSRVTLHSNGGVLTVPVIMNGRIALDFIIDSGAADVSVPADVVLTLARSGTLRDSDFLGTQLYELADGSTVPSRRFRIRSPRVGDRVLNDVVGSVAPVNGSLLLGQSFLSRFKSWSVDNRTGTLVLE